MSYGLATVEAYDRELALREAEIAATLVLFRKRPDRVTRARMRKLGIRWEVANQFELVDIPEGMVLKVRTERAALADESGARIRGL